MQRTSSYFSFFSFLIITLLMLQLKMVENSHHREKRLIPIVFPPTAPTRIQWIIGIGIPVEDLMYEAITTGWVLKAEYFLPETAEQLRTKHRLPINGRRRRSTPLFEQHLVDKNELYPNQTFWNLLEERRNVLSSYRWGIYKGLEGLAVKLGLPGRSCVLKSICEAAEVPFHYWNGLFGELLHILLTPSSSMDELSSHSDNEYFYAEAMGRSGAECHRVFTDCQRSLLDRFSEIDSSVGDMLSLFD